MCELWNTHIRRCLREQKCCIMGKRPREGKYVILEGTAIIRSSGCI